MACLCIARHSLRNILTNEMIMKVCSKHSDQKDSVGPGSSIHGKIIIIIIQYIMQHIM